MPNRNSFKTHEQYLEWYRNYRKNNIRIREYNRVYNTKWRKENNYSTDKREAIEHPEKIKARKTIYSLIRKRLIRRAPCEVCGKKKNIHAHHIDYSRPLYVVWLCSTHHAIEHIKLNKMKS